MKEALALLARPAIAYGKGAIVGPSGDIEHAAAILHPRMGKPMRDAIGGGQAIIPSNVKIGGVGAVIDLPLGHKDDVWSFDQIDTLSIMVPNAPRSDEIAVIVALADGGRPRPRDRQVRCRAAARSELTGEFDWIEAKPRRGRACPGPPRLFCS